MATLCLSEFPASAHSMGRQISFRRWWPSPAAWSWQGRVLDYKIGLSSIKTSNGGRQSAKHQQCKQRQWDREAVLPPPSPAACSGEPGPGGPAVITRGGHQVDLPCGWICYSWASESPETHPACADMGWKSGLGDPKSALIYDFSVSGETATDGIFSEQPNYTKTCLMVKAKQNCMTLV